MSVAAFCATEGCRDVAWARGVCGKHYQRLRASGNDECSVSDCTRPQRSRGWCSRHYQRWRRHDDPLAPGIVERARPYRGDQVMHRHYRQMSMPEHPLADKNGRIMEHRVVMERELGRLLKPHENVHHKNGLKRDNRPENLELWVKPQPCGQRLEDLLDWVVSNYADEVRTRL